MKLRVSLVLKPLLFILVSCFLLAGIGFAETVKPQQPSKPEVPTIEAPIVDEQVMQDAEKYIIEMQKKMMQENQKIMQPKVQQVMQEKMQKAVQPKMLEANQKEKQQDKSTRGR